MDKQVKLTTGQIAVLAVAAVPMAAVGIAGGVATYVNMDNVIHRSASALGLVAAGEGATLIAALVALAVTLMGQHTPAVTRAAMWLIPLAASGAGIALARTADESVIMGLTPMAMTAAGEGIAFVARRVVAYRTGVDIEQQRRSGLLLWHANRAVNGRGPGKWLSRSAVWRLTKQFAATDGQMSVQLGEVQRYRIGEGADANLAAVLSGATNKPQRAAVAPAPVAPALPPAALVEAVSKAHSDADDEDDHAWIREAMDDYSERMAEFAPPAPVLLSADEVAERLNVKPGTIRTWVSRNKLAVAGKDAHGRNLFRPEDVDAL